MAVKGGADGGHDVLNAPLGTVNVGTFHPGGVHAVIGVEQLQGGGEIIVEESADLRQLVRALGHRVHDLLSGVLQSVDLLGEGGVLNGVVESAHFGQGPVPLLEQLLDLRADRLSLSLLGLGLRGLLFRVIQFIAPVREDDLAQIVHRRRGQTGHDIVGGFIQRGGQRPHQPGASHHINGEDAFFTNESHSARSFLPA